MHRPCRHQFAARAKLGVELIKRKDIGERWLKSYQLHVPAVDEHIDEVNIASVSDSPAISAVKKQNKLIESLSKAQKYRKMLNLSQKLAVIGSEYGMKEFRSKISQVEELLQCWEQNILLVSTHCIDSSQVGNLHVVIMFCVSLGS